MKGAIKAPFSFFFKLLKSAFFITLDDSLYLVIIQGMEIHYKLLSRLLVKLFNEEMQKQFASEKLFTEEIYTTYSNAIEDYKIQYLKQENPTGTHLFYENKAFEDEILKLKFISNYNFEEAINILRKEPNVIVPTERELKNFQLIFDYHIQRNEKLRGLEIEATYKEEIFFISERVKELLSPDLQKEWEREISGYFETLKDFKPKTALKLLDNFLNKKDKNKPNNDLLAFVHYQKGICYSLLDKKDEKFKSFITAYTLNPTPKEYWEQAILAYYDYNDLQSLQPILENLQKEDPFNPIVWAINYFKTEIKDFQELIDKTPQIIKDDTLFQQIIFNHYYKVDTSLILKYEKDLLPALKDIEETVQTLDINIDTIHQSIFLVNWLFTIFVRGYNHMGFYSKIDEKSVNILKVINILLEKIIKATKDTDVDYPIFSSMYSFTKYGISKDKINLLEVIKDVKKIPIEGNSFYFFICANYLQIEGYNSQSLDIVDLLERVKQRNSERFLTSALKAFIFLKLENFEDSANTSIKSFNLIEYLEDSFALGYLHVIISIFLLKKLDKSLVERLEQLRYESSGTRNLIINYTKCLLEKSTANNECNIENWLVLYKENYQVILYVGNLYFFTKQYDKARSVYSQVLVDTIKRYPRELSYYIQSLFSSSKETNTSLLLSLCKYFRDNYPIDEYLLRIEYTISQRYLDRNRSLEITKIGYQQFLSEEWLVQIIWCLNKLEDNEEELHYYLDEFLRIDKANPSNIPFIASVLEHRYCIDKAVDLVYKYEEPNIRMILLNFNLKYNQKSKFKDKFRDLEKVEEGVYVSYKIDREKERTILVDTSSQNEGEKEFSELLLGHNLNDKLSYDSKYGKQTKSVKITRIEDKYVRAVRSIYKDAETPASGLPLEMFKFDKKDPIGSIQKIVGVDVSERKKYEEELLRKYYNYEYSILQISITDYFKQAYLFAVNIFSKTIGIHTISIPYTKKYLKQSSSYILDLSSLHSLYTISSQWELQLPTLYLSKYLEEVIKIELALLKREPDAYLTSLHGLPSYMRTESLNIDKYINYLEDILHWIKKNCTVILPPKAVDLLHITYLPHPEIKTDISYMINHIMPTRSIIEEIGGILITDDPIAYLSTGCPILKETASSEYFIKEILGRKDSTSSFFIENRYIDYTFTCEELIRLYNAKGHNQECLEKYNFVIDKIQLWNIDVCFDFILYILNTTENQYDIEKVITSLYKNRTKDNPINIIDTFQKRSIILNDLTLSKLFNALYSVIDNNEVI